MKTFFIYIIFFSIGIRSLFAPITLLFYTVEQDLFVEYLCTNNDKPELNCNGSCQLKKVDHLYQHQHKEDQREVISVSIHWIAQIITKFDFHFFNKTFSTTPIHYVNFYQTVHLNSAFKPPIV